ncbi:MAG TPA: TatD family hydrolase [Geminicoccaceae bacterium]
MLVDSHCHLDFPALAEERDAVLARARAAGVGLMQTIGTRLETFEQVLAIAEANPDIYCSVGVHPHRAAKEPLDGPGQLTAWAAHPKVIGIGESGLDYYYDHSPRDVQTDVFRLHIQAARQTGLPLIVHTRDADRDTAELLRAAMAEGPFTGVIHCYSSSPELGFAAVEMGLYLGIGGIVTFRKSDQLRATVRELPLERLLLETDAPYLAPEPFRGKRNEPAYVAHVAATLADIKGLRVAEIETATTDNFLRLFAKAKRPTGTPCA